MIKGKSEVLIGDITLAEGMRWRADKLWFSDLLGYRVMRIDVLGNADILAQVPHQPSGLGFDRDGNLLIVSMKDCRLLRYRDGKLEEAADLSPMVRAYCNDMAVDAAGRAYIGDVGFNRHIGEERRPGSLVRVDPGGALQVVADEIDFPNGAVFSTDGKQLLVAETFAGRITAFDVNANGDLYNRTVFAETGGTPDGIALDSEGALWVADHLGHRIFRVVKGGKITASIDTGERHTFCCALGGPSGHTLFYSTAIGNSHSEYQRNKQGRIEMIEVEVPAAIY